MPNEYTQGLPNVPYGYEQGLGALLRNGKNAAIPVNMRQFVSHLSGNRDPLTEKDFTASDLETLRAAIERVGGGNAGVIGYGDYKPSGFSDFFGFQGPIDVILNSYADPAYRLETTLGMAAYKRLPDGSYVVKDKYNFNAPSKDFVKKHVNKRGGVPSTLLDSYTHAGGMPGILNALGNIYGSSEDDPGNPVSIHLPASKPKNKASGGSVTMPDNSRSGGRVRMI